MKRLNQTLLCVLPMVLLAGCGGDQTPDAALTCETGVDALSVDGADATSASVDGDQAGACQANLYGNISDAAKWILSLTMLLGRLEIFTLLVLISPTFWRS